MLVLKKIMTINIRSLSKSYNLEVEPTYSIEHIKSMIQDKEGIPPDQIVLLYRHRLFENDKKSLDYYNIKDGETIFCTIKIRGHNYISILIHHFN